MSPKMLVLQLCPACCLFLWMAILVGRTAMAVTIFPGETVILPGTNLEERPELDGTVQVAAIVPFADPNNLYSGTIEVSVVQPPEFLPVEHYRILSFNASGSGFEIVGLDSSFQASSITMPLDVDYFDDTPGDRAPTTASLPSGPFDDFVFDSVRVNFAEPLMPGETSRTVFVVPNADIIIETLHDNGAGVLVRDPFGEVSKAPFQTFAVIIPEPAAVVLLGTFLLCTMAVYRRHTAFVR